MVDERERPKVSWGVVVALLTLLSGGVAAYTDLTSDQATMETRIKHVEEDVGDLDNYDIHLTEVTDSLRGDAIRTEAGLGNLQRTTEKLDATMSEMLKEIRRLNDNFIRSGISNEERS